MNKLTLTKWNDLIGQVNDLADECGGITHLDEVEAPHKWSKTDVQEMQDKLKEICSDHQFSEIPQKWKQRIIDEIEDAIAAGACCCEPAVTGTASAGYIGEAAHRQGNILFNTFWESSLFDWAYWLVRVRQPLQATIIQCEEDGVPTGQQREQRIGGFGYIAFGGVEQGGAYTRWELDAGNQAGVVQIASGDVVNGYIQLPEGGWQPKQVCGQPVQPGTILGDRDPAWGPPYSLEHSGGLFDAKVNITEFDGRQSGDIATESFVKNNVVLVGGWPTAPVSILHSTGQVFFGAPIEFTRFDPEIFELRLLCD